MTKRLYVWTDIPTGAYHEDGVAVVLADSKENAIELLRAQEGGQYETYHYADNVSDEHLTVLDLRQAAVIAKYMGCDC